MTFRLLLTLALLTVGGCSLMMPNRPLENQKPAHPPAAPAVQPPAAPQIPVPPPQPAPPRLPKPPAPPPPPGGWMGYVTGMELGAVQARLGPPSRITEVSPGRLLEYADGDCVVKIMFYPDLKDLKFRALSVETNQKDRGQNAVDQCLARIERKYDRPR